MSLDNVSNWLCLFEQSGTFKKQFQRLGLKAKDYDIANEYGETDEVIDLFQEIARSYDGKPSIFDGLKEGDAIIAFFPCVRFSMQAVMHSRCEARQFAKYTERQKAAYTMKIADEINKYYKLITKLVIISIDKKTPLIIENPYRENEHYLTRYWPFKPSIIDRDRWKEGDYYQKTTQYWFFNCKPYDNVIMDEPIAQYQTRRQIVKAAIGKERSEISPQYARRFIRRHLKPYNPNDAEEKE